LAEFKAAIEMMDASDVEFNISLVPMELQGSGGNITFDFKNNRVNLVIYDFGDMGYSSHPVNLEGRVAHELEHGRQFLVGELDFILLEDGTSVPGGAYDLTDERNAMKIQDLVHNLNNGLDKDRTSKDLDSQLKNYSKKRLVDYPFTATEAGTKEIEVNTPKGLKGYKSIYNYSPTEAQKAGRKSILNDE
jgi:hypothetical protein